MGARGQSFPHYVVVVARHQGRRRERIRCWHGAAPMSEQEELSSPPYRRALTTSSELEPVRGCPQAYGHGAIWTKRSAWRCAIHEGLEERSRHRYDARNTKHIATCKV